MPWAKSNSVATNL